MLQAIGPNAITGKVTQVPTWRKRPIRGSPGTFEPVILAAVTLTGGSGWLGPMVVRLDVTRLDAGVSAASSSLQEAARDVMRRFLYRSTAQELLKLNEMRLNPPKGAALEALETFIL